MWLNKNSHEQMQCEIGQNSNIAICTRSSVPHVENLQPLLHPVSVSTLPHLHSNYAIILLKLIPTSEAPVPLSFWIFLAKAATGLLWILEQMEWTDRAGHFHVSQEHHFHTSVSRDCHNSGKQTSQSSSAQWGCKNPFLCFNKLSTGSLGRDRWLHAVNW